MTSQLSLTINVSTKKGTITDTTDYAALGFTQPKLLEYGALGLGLVYFNGNLIVDKNTAINPLFDLANGVYSYEFDLVTDSIGEVAYGAYSAVYSVRMTAEEIPYAQPLTDTILVSDVPELSHFLQAGNEVTLYQDHEENFTISSISLNEETEVVSIKFTEDMLAEYEFMKFNVTNVTFEGAWTYSGCKLTKPCIEFAYDCEYGNRGMFMVVNKTDLKGGQLVGLNGKIYYPATLEQPVIQVTSLPYVNNQLAEGIFTVSVTQQIQVTNSDGLIVQYVISSETTEPVNCSGTLCGITPCINALLKVHTGYLDKTSISPLQATVDSISMEYINAMTSKACTDIPAYKKAIAAIQALLDSSGVDCGCGCSGEGDDAKWVFNTAPSFISDLQNVKTLIAQRIWDGVPDETVDFSQGMLVGYVLLDFNTGIEYVCTDNTVGNAVWAIHYKKPKYFYYAIVNQTGVNEPVFTNVVTNIQGAPFTSVDATGVYTIGFGGAELAGKCFINISNGLSGGTFGARRVDDFSFQITSSFDASAANDILIDATLKIEVYD